nr:hypothetical protein [Caldilineaceae bacterium]
MRSVSPFVRVCCLLALFSLSVYGWSFSTQLLFSAPTGDEFPVIMHPASQEFPAIDGDLVVWQDARFGPAEIFLADLSSGEITNLTQTADTWEANPAISGDYVVWRDGYQGIGIHGLKLSTREPLTVTSGLREISRPRLSGSIVVWADNRRGDGDWNIYGYDLASGEDLRLAEQPGNQTDPQIDGNLVVWVDETTGIVVYNLTSKATITLTLGASAWSPAVSESAQLVVWQDYRHADWDIYGYDLAAQREFPIFVGAGEQVNAGLGDTLVVYQSRLPGAAWEIAGYAIQQQLALPITLNSSTELFPAVDGATVVWQDSRNHQLDIYGYTWDGLPPVQPSYPLLAPTFLQAGALPAGQIVVRWHDTNQDESGYKLERTAGITGTRWIDLATLPASSEVYTDTPGVEGESYWYRVRAFNPTGVSPYSNEDFNTTFEATPSGLELYLMVLINAVRADPAHFGYPEYEPVPPLSFNPLLSYSARSHSQAILNGIYQFGHCDPVGRCSLERAEA